MPEEFIIYINLTASIFTIIASVVAVTTLIIWKRQQLLSPKINAIFDAEDNHQLLIMSYLNTVVTFYEIIKASLDAQGEIPKYVKSLEQKVNELKIHKEKAMSYDVDFRLSIFRVQRMGLFSNVDKCLNAKHLKEIVDAYINSMAINGISNDETIEKLYTDVSTELCKLKKQGEDEFRIVRKKLI